MDRKKPVSDGEETKRRPVIINFKNATFCHHRSQERQLDENARSFMLNPINGEIKKVSKFYFSNYSMRRRHLMKPYNFPSNRVISCAWKDRLVVEKRHF